MLAPSPEARAPEGVAIAPLASFAPQAWRNGGGTTRALAEDTEGGWRISLADVERDGPYSRFPGMTRQSLVMTGAGVTLQDDAVQCHLRRGIAMEYDGGVAWQATLHDGPVVALNVMALRGRYRARIEPLRDAAFVPLECVALVLTMNGRCLVHAADSDDEIVLAEGHVLTRMPGAPALHLAPRSSGSDASIALVIVEPDSRR
ncbi:HutD family protein [Caballeronia sp. TF1N1]|uniref:HutD/Ves family protein n=1 Tax=Caballeronia sp. TF1N1 TaxID=2878153 RepID=UPI001FD509EE|nr:HutD family protein [Caballeronia sp. TF1N1]